MCRSKTHSKLRQKNAKSGNICKTEIAYTWFFHVRPPLCIFRKIQEQMQLREFRFGFFFETAWVKSEAKRLSISEAERTYEVK